MPSTAATSRPPAESRPRTNTNPRVARVTSPDSSTNSPGRTAERKCVFNWIVVQGARLAASHASRLRAWSAKLISTPPWTAPWGLACAGPVAMP